MMVNVHRQARMRVADIKVTIGMKVSSRERNCKEIPSK